MHKIILHSDLNCFYASAEINEDPTLLGKRVAVCGSTENRHGIVLTANYPAKRCGVKTGMANWEALRQCPDLVMVEPHYELYMKYSRLVRRIYSRYSNDIEPFGMDENWISIEGCRDVEHDGLEIGEEIRRTVQEETGLTVSIGVSFSKIFAKLGSDMKKPNAVTVISRGNYREKVWPLPVEELLYVGHATRRRLRKIGVRTIGELAAADPSLLRAHLGKNGLMLRRFADATDTSPVMPADFTVPVKSVGHGTTCVRDLYAAGDVWCVLLELAQDVGHRLRTHEMAAKGVRIMVRSNELLYEQYQTKLPFPTRSPLELAHAGFALFTDRYRWDKPVRALTISAIDLISEYIPVQTDLFNDAERHEKQRRLDDAVDDIRRRFGYAGIRPASLMHDLMLAQDKCETVPMPGLMYR